MCTHGCKELKCHPPRLAMQENFHMSRKYQTPRLLLSSLEIRLPQWLLSLITAATLSLDLPSSVPAFPLDTLQSPYGSQGHPKSDPGLPCASSLHAFLNHSTAHKTMSNLLFLFSLQFHLLLLSIFSFWFQ